MLEYDDEFGLEMNWIRVKNDTKMKKGYRVEKMKQQRANREEVKKEIVPYVKREFLFNSYIEINDVVKIYESLGRKYKNIHIKLGSNKDGYLCLKIYIKACLFSETMQYEVREKGKRKCVQDPLSWMDEIEVWNDTM